MRHVASGRGLPERVPATALLRLGWLPPQAPPDGRPHTSPAPPARGLHSDPAPPEPRPPSPPPPAAPVGWLRPAAPGRVHHYITALPGHLLHQAPDGPPRSCRSQTRAPWLTLPALRWQRPSCRCAPRAPPPAPSRSGAQGGWQRCSQSCPPQEPTSTQVISPSEQHLFREQEGSFPGNGTRSRGLGKSSRSWCSEELSRVFWIQNWKRAAL